MFRTLSDKSVRIVLGTDTLDGWGTVQAGLNTIQEMELIAEAGVPPPKIVCSATRDAAKRHGFEKELEAYSQLPVKTV